MDCGLDGKTFTRPSLCKPQFAADCDLSIIVQRFLRTGQLPNVGSRTPLEGDFTGVGDFQTIQDTTAHLIQDFEQLPIEERQKFNNDPSVWLESLRTDDSPVSEDIPASDDKPTSDNTPAPDDMSASVNTPSAP